MDTQNDLPEVKIEPYSDLDLRASSDLEPGPCKDMTSEPTNCETDIKLETCMDDSDPLNFTSDQNKWDYVYQIASEEATKVDIRKNSSEIVISAKWTNIIPLVTEQPGEFENLPVRFDTPAIKESQTKSKKLKSNGKTTKSKTGKSVQVESRRKKGKKSENQTLTKEKKKIGRPKKIVSDTSDTDVKHGEKVKKRKYKRKTCVSTCEQCGKNFQDKQQLRRHMRTHTGERPYACSYCGACFSDSSTRNQHVRRHTGEKPYCCKTCGKGFAGSNDLKKHERIHTGEKRYLCDMCGQGFSTSANMRSHRNTHLNIKQFKCSVCEKEFATQVNLKYHATIHTGERNYQCKICGSTFRQHGSFCKHKKMHLADGVTDESKPFVCIICNRGCLTESNLRAHRGTHNRPAGYNCADCGEKFNDLIEIENHCLTHSDEKGHACKHCSKAFAYVDSLEEHTKIHKEKKYQCICKICGVKCHDKDSYREHKLTHDKPEHVCDICGKAFGNVFILKRHWMIHTGEKQHKCEECGKAFVQQVNLKTHMRIHTGEKPFKCTVCYKQFTQSSNWKSHMMRDHGVDREFFKNLKKPRVKNQEMTFSDTQDIDEVNN